MVQNFPMFRLATQLARQLSSPVAARIKVYAKAHPRFGRAVCCQLARRFRTAEHRARLWSLRLGGAPGARAGAGAPVLSDAEALSFGADLLGELVIFLLGAAIVVFEVNRQALLKEAKGLERRSRWMALRLQLEELRREVQLQQADLDRLHGALLQLRRPREGPKEEPAGAGR